MKDLGEPIVKLRSNRYFKILELVEYHSNWDAAKTGVAHRITQSKFKNAVDQGITPVIVDNTLLFLISLKNYFQLSKIYRLLFDSLLHYFPLSFIKLG